MNDTELALAVSHELDDEQRVGGQTPSALRGVHTALSARAPLQASSKGLRDRILAAVDAREPAPIPVYRTATWNRWAPLALAAAVVLGVGTAIVSVAVRQSLAPGGPIGPGPISVRPPSVFDSVAKFDPAKLVVNPRRPEAAMAATVEAPMLLEARAIRDDARAAMKSVLSPLPVEVGFALRQ